MRGPADPPEGHADPPEGHADPPEGHADPLRAAPTVRSVGNRNTYRYLQSVRSPECR
jgi:hypothetical protein